MAFSIYKNSTTPFAKPELEFKFTFLPDGGLKFIKGGFLTPERFEFFSKTVHVRNQDDWPDSRRPSEALPPLSLASPLADLWLLVAMPNDGYVGNLLAAAIIPRQAWTVGDRILAVVPNSPNDVAWPVLPEALGANPHASKNLWLVFGPLVTQDLRWPPPSIQMRRKNIGRKC